MQKLAQRFHISSLKKQDVQVVGLQAGDWLLFLTSLPRLRGGWSANKSLQPRRCSGVAELLSLIWLEIVKRAVVLRSGNFSSFQLLHLHG
jgi:hypothetical protein